MSGENAENPESSTTDNCESDGKLLSKLAQCFKPQASVEDEKGSKSSESSKNESTTGSSTLLQPDRSAPLNPVQNVAAPQSLINLAEISNKFQVKPAVKAYGGFNDPSRFYPMLKKPRGYVLIINNENFKTENKRLGTDVDGMKLTSLFEQLSFELYCGKQFSDLTTEKMKSTIKEFSEYKAHANAEASVVCILSHGDAKGVLGVDGETLREQEICQNFLASRCPHLAGKPKIFLFVTCLGNKGVGGYKQSGPQKPNAKTTPNIFEADCSSMELEGETDSDGRPVPVSAGYPFTSEAGQQVLDDAGHRIPNNADFLYIYSTDFGCPAFRHTIHGTWFVQDFVQVVAEEAGLYTVASMVNKVNALMSIRSNGPDKQSMMKRDTLRKDLYLNPGLHEQSA